MSQKLQIKADLTLEVAIQIACHSEMVKSQITDQSSLAVKNLEEVQGQKKPVPSHPRRGKGKKAEFSQKRSQKKCGRCDLNHRLQAVPFWIVER